MKLAAEMGLESESLARALDSHRFTGEVLGDEEEARRIGIRAVPSFVSNGQVIAAGVQTTDRLRELLKGGSEPAML